MLLEQLFRATGPYNERFHEEGKMYHEYDRATQSSILQELLSGQELLESTSTLKSELMQLARDVLEKELAHQHLNVARH